MDAMEKLSTWIDLDAWLRRISLLPALHILVIIDACHSGVALHPRMRSRDIDMRQHGSFDYLRSRSSRHVLTSARAEQVAADGGPNDHHSLFTTLLLEALDTLPGVGVQRLVTGSALALHVRDQVSSFATQIPDFGRFGSDDRGDLVLELGSPPHRSPAAQRRIVWLSISAWLRLGTLLVRRMMDALARARIPLLALVAMGVLAGL